MLFNFYSFIKIQKYILVYGWNFQGSPAAIYGQRVFHCVFCQPAVKWLSPVDDHVKSYNHNASSIRNMETTFEDAATAKGSKF